MHRTPAGMFGQAAGGHLFPVLVLVCQLQHLRSY
jgi:hypothetical protein